MIVGVFCELIEHFWQIRNKDAPAVFQSLLIVIIVKIIICINTMILF